MIGMHWGTFVLSLEPIMEPPVRFKAGAEKYGFKKEDTIIYKIGEFGSLKKLLDYNKLSKIFFLAFLNSSSVKTPSLRS